MIKLNQIISSQDALKKLLEVKLPVKVAYKISKLVNKMQPDLKAFDDAKIKLLQELGEPAKDSMIVNGVANTYQIKPENIGKFQEEMAKLLEIDVDLKFGDKEFEKISIEDLGDISLEPQSLSSLSWLIN